MRSIVAHPVGSQRAPGFPAALQSRAKFSGPAALWRIVSDNGRFIKLRQRRRYPAS